MSVLTRNAIWKEMENHCDPLVIMPLLDTKQVGPSSIDMRLGNQFIILRRAAVTHVDPTNHKELTKQIQRSQQKIRVSLHDAFIIHPGQLALGSTLEYLSLPKTLTATVEGRSSWGRLGLIIATACNIDPGFKGCITLELVNNGEVPIVLYPGIRIAQIVFHRAEQEADYRKKCTESNNVKDDIMALPETKYDCPIGPQFSRINQDKEILFWGTKER
jgi:dCTP deaminase